MTRDDVIEKIGTAYGEPTDEITERLFDLVHIVWDQTKSEHENLHDLLVTVDQIRGRVTMVINRLADLYETAPLEEGEDAAF